MAITNIKNINTNQIRQKVYFDTDISHTENFDYLYKQTLQVITGGQYDVDVKVEGPNKEIIYQQQKMQYDSHQFTALHTGNLIVYSFLLT